MNPQLYDIDPVEFAEFVEGLPPDVRPLTKEFPWGGMIYFADGGPFYVIGWYNHEAIMASLINPREGEESKRQAERYYKIFSADKLRKDKVTAQ